MIIQVVDGVPVRLREPHDLSFLQKWGRVFCTFDDQDSGNLCFGVRSSADAMFVKYAGAATLHYGGSIADAVARLRRAAPVYRALAHPSLIRLRDAVEVNDGYALIFDWSDGVTLGRQFEQRARLAGLSVEQRCAGMQQILDFHAEVARRGWVAVDLYDGSLLVDPRSGVVTLCDLDFYEGGACGQHDGANVGIAAVHVSGGVRHGSSHRRGHERLRVGRPCPHPARRRRDQTSRSVARNRNSVPDLGEGHETPAGAALALHREHG